MHSAVEYDVDWRYISLNSDLPTDILLFLINLWPNQWSHKEPSALCVIVLISYLSLEISQ